jgi:hypothetical protein
MSVTSGFMGEYTIACIFTSFSSFMVSLLYRYSGWPVSTVGWACADGLAMGLTSVIAVAGMAHVGTRNDTRGFKAILAGAAAGTLLALLMKLRPSLEVIALGVPSLTARMAIEYTDHQAAKELARAERLPNSKRAAMSKAFRSREDGDREELHVQA